MSAAMAAHYRRAQLMAIDHLIAVMRADRLVVGLSYFGLSATSSRSTASLYPLQIGG